ncbi:MAG TPA: oxidoreductase [Acidimicrobiales bacterium]|nr:oxidoreductase [Acidimicrobiales bacterium]
MAKWTAADIPDQTGRTILITGANSGLGLRSAEALAAAGARVLMACRNAEKAAAAQKEVAAKATGPDPEVVSLDLSDLDDVARSADGLVAELGHLDVLLNNAGVMAVPLARTPQGYEMQMGTNHLGHFALTGRLLPLLLKSGAPRVVTVSSFGHKPGRIRFDDPNWEKGRYHAWPAYFQTKLANLLFTAELDRQAREAGTKLVAAAAHPGYASTNLTASGPGSFSPFVRRGGELVDKVFGQSDAKGALPQLYAATMPDVEGNDYWGPDGFLEQRGHPTKVGRTRRAADADAAQRLWSLSEALTGVTFAWT